MAHGDLELRRRRRAHLIALGQMFVVTLLWSSSFPIHKVLLNAGMPPLTLAAYRYFLAALILAAALWVRRGKKAASQKETPSIRSYTLLLLIIGLCMYGAQGIHMTALSLLTASDSGLVSMTWAPIAVGLLMLMVDRSFPRFWQCVGFCVVLTGLFLYFPADLQKARTLGIALNILSASTWAVAVVLTHRTFRQTTISALELTAFTMLAGSSLLLIVALIHDRAYVPPLWQAAWLGYLALVNTAVGFALYNHTMRVLAPFELVVFQDSMIVQVGILSAIFLGEVITPSMAFGMIVVVAGIAVVQVFAPRVRVQEEKREELTPVLK
jgi:drug/metabolite transporter (DMT)-like permease